MEHLPAPEKTHPPGKPSAAAAAAAEQMKIVLLIVFLLSSSGSRLLAALTPNGLTLMAFKSAVSGDPSASLAGWDEAHEDPCR